MRGELGVREVEGSHPSGSVALSRWPHATIRSKKPIDIKRDWTWAAITMEWADTMLANFKEITFDCLCELEKPRESLCHRGHSRRGGQIQQNKIDFLIEGTCWRKSVSAEYESQMCSADSRSI